MPKRRWWSSPRKRPSHPPPPAGENATTDSTFEWEFDADAAGASPLPPVLYHRPAQPAGQPGKRQDGAAGSGARPHREPAQEPQDAAPSPLAAKYRGEAGARRARYIRHLLDGSLERWWSFGELAPPSLLREGLLVLEAGHVLDEAQQSLLLRSALYYRRGLVTALRHQADPERAALLIKEAVMDWEPPLAPETLAWLRDQDPLSFRWTEVLRKELGEAIMLAGPPRRGYALAALQALQGEPHSEPPAEPPAAGSIIRDRAYPQWARIGLLIALALIVIGLAWQRTAVRLAQDMVEVAPGTYTLRDPEAADIERKVHLNGFLIDRYEVTNGEYRRCYERGVCPWPNDTASATRPGYFTDASFAQHPVVQVTWAAADAYCAWAGKRLPTAEEWEVGAGYAPATNRHHRYPWGDQFELQRANSAESGLGDTTPVGSFRPAGDSPSGLSDTAGNAAEWTSTWVRSPEVAGYIVKGGDFASGAAELEVTAQRIQPAGFAATWLGFRCARTLP